MTKRGWHPVQLQRCMPKGATHEHDPDTECWQFVD
jgi:hypothetical protein